MFGVFFSILVFVALLSIFGEFVMRVRLSRKASRDKIGSHDFCQRNRGLPASRNVSDLTADLNAEN
jgi:hypothetical protein